MKILVTGASGYLGKHVVNKLVKNGYNVIACDLFNKINNPEITFIESDIFNEEENLFELAGKPDICIHLAWRDGFKHNSESHMIDLPKHIDFCKKLMDNGIKKLIVMGTMHEIGFWEGEIDENTPCNPMSEYGKAKNTLREKLFEYSKEYGVKLIWLRAFYIVGDCKNGSSIFSKILKAEENGEKHFPFTSGKNKYDFIDIDDLANMIVKTSIQEKYDGIINVCSGKPVALGEKVESFIKENKYKIKLDYGKYPDRPYDSKIIYGNTDIINEIMKL